jgi:hypothetical protein
VASPLRFRRSTETWSADRVHRQLHQPLDGNLGASRSSPRFDPPPGCEATRFDMDDGSMALFCWDDDGAYWLGNTETPSALWRTEKYTFDEVPYPVARWAQRVLLADFADQEPLLSTFDHVAWLFLPVFFSKDGAESTRAFFRDHAAGFPDASPQDALAFYESLLRTGVLDDHRYEMAAKLGTSEHVDPTRMQATTGELVVAGILDDAGYDVTPEIEVTTGHSLDYRADRDGRGVLVEVTRPTPPTRRAAGTPVRAVTETAETKAGGQLSEHGGGAVLFVDCSSFRDDEWAQVRGERPAVHHRPAVVFRARPDGRVEGYSKGSVPLALDGAVEWVG